MKDLDLKLSKYIYYTYLSKTSYFHKPLPLARKFSPLSRSITHTDQPKYPYQQRLIINNLLFLISLPSCCRSRPVCKKRLSYVVFSQYIDFYLHPHTQIQTYSIHSHSHLPIYTTSAGPKASLG